MTVAHSLHRVVVLPGPISLAATIGRYAVLMNDPGVNLGKHGAWCAFRTDAGPATVHYVQIGECEVEATAWGEGRECALAAAPAHLGSDDRPEDFTPEHPLIASIHARRQGLRFGRTGRVFESLVRAVLGQKVTGKGASRSWRELVFRYGEPAPGPDVGPKLWIMPAPARLAQMAYFDFHPLGVERKRAEVLIAVGREAGRLEKSALDGGDALRRRLSSIRGIGPWTTEIVASGVLGDADAVPLGDYHIPSLVVHAFTGEARGSDEQMVELLEPFRPHRGRVIALLAAAGVAPARRGPRMAVRDIRRL